MSQTIYFLILRWSKINNPTWDAVLTILLDKVCHEASNPSSLSSKDEDALHRGCSGESFNSHFGNVNVNIYCVEKKLWKKVNDKAKRTETDTGKGIDHWGSGKSEITNLFLEMCSAITSQRYRRSRRGIEIG